MSAPVRPTSYAGWASGVSGYVAEPIAADKAQGFLPTGIARSSYINWLLNGGYQWQKYLDESLITTLSPLPPTTDVESPQIALRGPSGPSGLGRFQVDHQGFPIAPNISVVHEDWAALSTTATLYSGRIVEQPKWFVSGSGLGVSVQGVEPYNFHNAPSVYLQTGGQTLSNRVTISSIQRLVPTGVSGTISVLSADVGVDEITRFNGTDVRVGVAGNRDAFNGLAGYAWFRRPVGATSWFAEVATGVTASTSVSCNVRPNDGATSLLQQMRIEMHATGSPYGAVTRFIVEGQCVATGPAYARQGYVVGGVNVATGGGAGGFLLQLGAVDLAGNKR